MVERQTSSGPRPMVYQPESGELFAGRYRIDRLLGRGMAGAVWSAVDEDVGDRVALKLLTAGPDDAVERFRREVRLARRVTHRNAARIFDLGHVDTILYLTMELVDGESLEGLLSREAPLKAHRAAEIGRQVAQGLAAAHDVEVVHRDIKPANVLLERTGRVVVTDFGVARALDNDAKVTLGAAMIGTPSYMAPEQVRGQPVGPAADLYALGALMYEMLTGKCPFVADGVVATATARLHSDPVDPREHATIPNDLSVLVLELLARDPSDRPSSAANVARAFAALAETADVTDTAATLLGKPNDPGTSAVATNTPTRQTTGSSSTFVSIAPEDRTLAVLPFRFRGPSEHAHLAESFSEDLVDVLTTTRGLRVTASGATAKYRGDSVDPREAGRELGTDAIVDGSVRVVGQVLRVSSRLVDVATGEQLWVERFEVPLTGGSESEETTAQRIAEGLRLELELLSARHRVSDQAVDLLLEARQRSAVASLGEDNLSLAMELLERALEIAPDFHLAVATHADFAVRRWFLPSSGPNHDVAKRAHESVARALKQAPHLPLSHFAAGRLAVSDGRFGDAANELALALKMAPTFAAAHDYLGMLQCEAGRGDEGERHILLARVLDPDLPAGPALARRHALLGNLDAYRAVVAELKKTPAASRFMIESLELRVAGWFGDLDTVRRCRPSTYVSPGHAFHRFMEAQRAGLLGEGSAEELLETLRAALAMGAGPRLDAFIHQLAIEALVPLGDLDHALEELCTAADLPAFVDTDWLERCPALDLLRDRAEFRSILGMVSRRADAIWRVPTA